MIKSESRKFCEEKHKNREEVEGSVHYVPRLHVNRKLFSYDLFEIPFHFSGR